jgi:CMP-N-acetylneuraminic acid synthetase
MLEVDNMRGKQLIPHNLYRRQDYPKVFEISHFISIFMGFELDNLNSNLYNNDTIFYPIDNIIDVDTQKDLDSFTS